MTKYVYFVLDHYPCFFTDVISALTDDRLQMNIVLNQVPLVHSKSPASSSWDTHSSKFTISEEFISEPEKTTSINRQPSISGIQLPNATSMDSNAWNWQLTSKGTTAEVFSQGLFSTSPRLGAPFLNGLNFIYC